MVQLAYNHITNIKELQNDKTPRIESSTTESDEGFGSNNPVMSEDDWSLLLNGSGDSANTSCLLKFQKGDVIIQEGHRHYMICQIVHGTCNIQKILPGSDKPTIVATASEGETLGEIAFIRETTASASVIAKTDVEMYIIDGLYVRSLITSNPQLVARIYHFLCCVLTNRITKMESESSRS